MDRDREAPRPASPLSVWAMVAGVVLVSCGEPDSNTEQQPPSPPDPEQPTAMAESLPAHMGEHFWRMSDAQNAAIAGDLNGLSAAAQWLADHETAEGLPQGSEAMVEELRTHAQRAASTSDLTQATMALAQTVAACGTCHEATGNTLPTVIDRPVAGPGPTDLVSQMGDHIRAADLLWDGLLAPSKEAWEAGIAALHEVQVRASDVSEQSDQLPMIQSLLDEINRIAIEGAGAPPVQRAPLFGQLLVTCGQCHSALGRGFKPGAP